MAITVADYMKKEPVTLRSGDDTALADSVMREGRLRHVPIVKDGKLVGLVTRTDLLRSGTGGGGANARRTLVDEVMTREVMSVRPESRLADAVGMLLEHKIGCLPVVDAGHQVIGIITETDIVRFAADVIEDLDRVDALAGQVRGDASTQRHGT
jgi:CBS domain-containing protein